MLEFYQAYSDYHDLMDLTEELFAHLAKEVTAVDGGEIRRARNRFREVSAALDARSHLPLLARGRRCRVPTSRNWPRRAGRAASRSATTPGRESHGREPLVGLAGSKDGEITGLLFETLAEAHLIQPTILYDFPTDISPLSKCREDDPSLVERFEIYVAGWNSATPFPS